MNQSVYKTKLTRCFETQLTRCFAGLRPAVLLKKCFPVKFAKFLRTVYFREHIQWLLLQRQDKTFRNFLLHVLNHTLCIHVFIFHTLCIHVFTHLCIHTTYLYVPSTIGFYFYAQLCSNVLFSALSMIIFDKTFSVKLKYWLYMEIFSPC